MSITQLYLFHLSVTSRLLVQRFVLISPVAERAIALMNLKINHLKHKRPNVLKDRSKVREKQGSQLPWLMRGAKTKIGFLLFDFHLVLLNSMYCDQIHFSMGN